MFLILDKGSNAPVHLHTLRVLLLMQLAKLFNLSGVSLLKAGFVKTNILLLATGARGIRFYNSEPYFSHFAIATVRLNELLDTRYGSEGRMSNADAILAKRLGISEVVMRRWINDNQYVWHERQDDRRIDLLCHDIHSNISHTGGIAMNKIGLGS